MLNLKWGSFIVLLNPSRLGECSCESAGVCLELAVQTSGLCWWMGSVISNYLGQQGCLGYRMLEVLSLLLNEQQTASVRAINILTQEEEMRF